MATVTRSKVLRVLGAPHRHHGDNLLDVTWSSATGLVATAANDGSVALWDGRDGGLRRLLPRRPDAVTGLVFAADGRLYTVTRAGIQVVVVKSGKVRATWPHKVEGSPTLAVNADRGYLACTHPHGKQVVVHDLHTGNVLHTVPLACARLGQAAFSRDGRYLYAVGRDPHRLLGYDLDAGRQTASRELDQAPGPLAISPDGAHLVLGVGKGLGVHDLPSLEVSRTLRPIDRRIEALAFAPDGGALFLGCGDGSLARIDLPGGQLKWRQRRTHQQVRALAASPDGAVVATIGPQGAPLCFWSAADGAVALPLVGHQVGVDALDWSADGKLLCTAARDGRLLLWDGKHAAPTRMVRQYQDGLCEVVFAAEGKLWTAHDGGLLQQIDLGKDRVRGGGGTGAGRAGDTAGGTTGGREPATLQSPADAGDLRCAVLRADLGLAVTAHVRQTLLVWDLSSGRTTARLRLGGARDNRAGCLAVADKGDYLVAGGRDGVLEVFDLGAKKLLHALTPHKNTRPIELRFIDHSRFVSVSHNHAAVTLFDAATGAKVHTLDTGQQKVHAIAVSADRKRLAVAGDRGIRVYDPRTWRLLRDTSAFVGTVRTLRFGPKGRLLAAGMHDCRIFVMQWQRMP